MPPPAPGYPVAAPATAPVPGAMPPAAFPPSAFPVGVPLPSGPPARVGGAVAALVVALCTLAVPALGISLGLWFFILVTNIPGIVLGIIALVKIPDAEAVERYIRYTWACTFACTALSVVFLVPVIVLALMFLMLGF